MDESIRGGGWTQGPPRAEGSRQAATNKVRRLASVGALAALFISSGVAHATNHFVRMEQVMAGANGDSRVQFIEMKASDDGQTAWGPQCDAESAAMLTFHDATGLKTGEFKFPTNAPVGGPDDPANNGKSVLIATQAFVDLTGLAADFLIAPLMKSQDGMVCFRENPAAACRFDVNLCLTYGNYQGPAESDECAQPIGSAASPLPIAGATPQSLNRFQDFGFSCFNLHNSGFQLEAPSPRNNAGQTATVPAASLVAQGENLFNLETFNGNGRTCESCHTSQDRFGIAPATIATKFSANPLDPLFVAENEPALSQLENACLMRGGNLRGLILENIDGFGNPPVFRNSPHLLNIALTAPYGLSVAATNLVDFCQGAIQQHFPKTLARNTDPSTGPLDIRLGTLFELQAMEAFMNSIKFPADGDLDLDRMITFAVAHGADAAAVQRGRDLFFGVTGQAQCFRCHNGPALADADGSLGTGTTNLNFDTGVQQQPANANDGCSGGPGDPTVPLPLEAGGARQFNTPPLVGVGKTAPFFHDNSVATLRAAVAFYDSLQFNNSPAGQLLPQAIQLTNANTDDLTAFLQAISVDPTACGNGIVTAPEECDDGNNDDTDACKNDCTNNVCGDGVVRTGVEDCDDGNTVSGDCCSAACLAETAGSSCADDGSICTVDECDGLGACVHPAGNTGTPCRAGVDSCDATETCDGSSPTCPVDQLQPAGTVCRPAGVCDVEETCDGASSACPSNQLAPNGTPCDDGADSTAGDMCTNGSCIGEPVIPPVDLSPPAPGKKDSASVSCLKTASAKALGFANVKQRLLRACLDAVQEVKARQAAGLSPTDIGKAQVAAIKKCLERQPFDPDERTLLGRIEAARVKAVSSIEKKCAQPGGITIDNKPIGSGASNDLTRGEIEAYLGRVACDVDELLAGGYPEVQSDLQGFQVRPSQGGGSLSLHFSCLGNPADLPLLDLSPQDGKKDAASVSCQRTIGVKSAAYRAKSYGFLRACLDAVQEHKARVLAGLAATDIQKALDAATKKCLERRPTDPDEQTLLGKLDAQRIKAISSMEKKCATPNTQALDGKSIGSGASDDYTQSEIEEHIDHVQCVVEQDVAASYPGAATDLMQFMVRLSQGGDALSQHFPCLVP